MPPSVISGHVAQLSLGRVVPVKEPKLFWVPYLTYTLNVKVKDPRILYADGLFYFAQFDWYYSDASALFSEHGIDGKITRCLVGKSPGGVVGSLRAAPPGYGVSHARSIDGGGGQWLVQWTSRKCLIDEHMHTLRSGESRSTFACRTGCRKLYEWHHTARSFLGCIETTIDDR